MLCGAGCGCHTPQGCEPPNASAGECCYYRSRSPSPAIHECNPSRTTMLPAIRPAAALLARKRSTRYPDHVSQADSCDMIVTCVTSDSRRRRVRSGLCSMCRSCRRRGARCWLAGVARVRRSVAADELRQGDVVAPGVTGAAGCLLECDCRGSGLRAGPEGDGLADPLGAAG